MERGKILRGEAGIGKKRKDVTFAEAQKLFLAWADTNKRPNTARFYRKCLLRLEESFGGKRLSEITSFLIERHKRVRVKVGALVAPNREIGVDVSRCFEWKKFEGANPAGEVKLLREPRGRLATSVDEEKKLLEAAREPLRTLILLASTRVSGSRRGLRTVQELDGWKTLDLVQRYAHLSPSHKAATVERISRENFAANSSTLFAIPAKGAATA